MADKVKIVVAGKHENYLNESKFDKEVQDVQNYFDTADFHFKEDTISFVFLKGRYQKVTQKMLVAGVYVNWTNKKIIALKSSLRLRLKGKNTKIAVMHSTFPPDLLGILNSGEGLLVHLEIPVIGLDEDQDFSIKDINGELFNIEAAYK